jgi:predicted 3-demethylubiquinone-9 3-methyltransferase (glyoxalase superfamily)
MNKIATLKIHPCLWFDANAEEAVTFYTSIFKNSSIKSVARYGKDGPMPEGTVMTIQYELEGQLFTALNGGPAFKFNEAVSFIVGCNSQEELDSYWDALVEGGKEQRCGWLKDKYGVSWQIVPAVIGELMSNKDPKKTGNVMRELMKMTKLDIATLEKAYNQ